MIFFGLDGGASKTDIIVANCEGTVLAATRDKGSNYSSLGGAENFRRAITQYVTKALDKAQLNASALTEAAFGLPTYGEVEETEEIIPAILHDLLPHCKIDIVNDAVVGWSGSLGGRPGINIAAGTGSIGYGIDEKNNQARVGGWSTLFSDEGSCSWIGIRAMVMFFKQSDGRLPRTILYDIFKEAFHLTKKDIYFLDNFLGRFRTDKSEYAKMQLLAYQAYLQGDPTIEPLYNRAAWELSELVRALIRKLEFSNSVPVQVSYSGSLFKVGELILAPFRKYLSDMNVELVPPAYPPNIGAVALAARNHLDEAKLATMLFHISTSLNDQG